MRLGILGKRGEAVELLENGQEQMGAVQVVKATEVLVMLVEASNDQFGSVVGTGDGLAFNTVNQLGPMAFQEQRDGLGIWCLSEVFIPRWSSRAM